MRECGFGDLIEVMGGGGAPLRIERALDLLAE